MKKVRFEINGRVGSGELHEGVITCLSGEHQGDEFELSNVRLLCPTIPTKVVAIGLNYRDHAEEMGEELPKAPLLFLKPSSSVIGPGGAILLPEQSQRIDYEAELAIVIGSESKNVSKEHAAEKILGYTCLNDVTARDLQKKDGQWTRAKGFDTFCPIGPWIETEFDFTSAKIELRLSGEVKQTSNISNLIFNPLELVEFVSSVMTLYPGDVIATGTTSGIGPMKDGDSVEVYIEGVGSLINPVRSSNG